MAVPWSKTVWLNGGVVSAEEATVSALDRALHFGDGLFETVRAYSGVIFALEEHLARLKAGARAMRLPLPPDETIREALYGVLEANGLEDGVARVTITPGPEWEGSRTGQPNLVAVAWPLPRPEELGARGARAVLLPWARFGGPAIPWVKTTSRAAHVLGDKYFRARRAHEGIFVAPDGTIREGTTSNVFVVKGDRLLTPPLPFVLRGVTRDVVLTVAGKVGLRAEEARVKLETLFSADEAALTSTIREVVPLVKVEGRPVGSGKPGPKVAALAEAFREYVREYVAREKGKAKRR